MTAVRRLLLVAAVLAAALGTGLTPADAELATPVYRTDGVEGNWIGPNTNVIPAQVWDLQTIGNTVYAAGQFTHVVSTQGAWPRIPQPFLAAYDASSGRFLDWWRPVLDGPVWALDMTPTGQLLVAGEFDTVNGVPRSNLVALDARTGAIDPTFIVNRRQDDAGDDGSGAAGSTMGLMTPTTGEPSTGGPTTGREPGADPVGYAPDGRLVQVGRTAVRVWARPGPSSRPVLLALHGWSDAGLVYRTLARELEDVLDVVAPDAPAHGDTTVSLPPRFTFDDLLPSVLQVYDALDELVGPGRPKVVTGHSMGAMLAASLAARRPEVRHLFLEEPPGPSLMPAPMYRRHELAGLQRLQQLEHADRMLRTGHTEDWSEDDRDAWSITKGQADLTAMAGSSTRTPASAAASSIAR